MERVRLAGIRARLRERPLRLATEARDRLMGPAVRPSPASRVWLNGRELGGPDLRFVELGRSHD